MKSLGVILCCLWFAGHAQVKYPFYKWKPDIIKQARSIDSSYLTHNETQVIFYMNLARMNPELFGQTFVQKYLDDETTGERDSARTVRNSYVVSLKRDLKATKPMKPFLTLKDLFVSANKHAIHMGKTGEQGHDGFDERLGAILKTHNGVAEDCDYGNHDPLDIIMHLMIDKDVQGVGHRKAILDRTYVYTAASIQPHKLYGWNCVIDFAGKSNSNSN